MRIYRRARSSRCFRARRRGVATSAPSRPRHGRARPTFARSSTSSSMLSADRGGTFRALMPSVVRFAMATTPQAGASAAFELGAYFDAVGLELQPVFVPNYRALYDAVHDDEADAAWCPPIVARDLRRDGAAAALVCVERHGAPAYFSAIVGSALLHSPADVHRFGWVSELS